MIELIMEQIELILSEIKVRPVILHLKIDDVTYYLVIRE